MQYEKDISFYKIYNQEQYNYFFHHFFGFYDDWLRLLLLSFKAGPDALFRLVVRTC
jgi:hypothetical protein